MPVVSEVFSQRCHRYYLSQGGVPAESGTTPPRMHPAAPGARVVCRDPVVRGRAGRGVVCVATGGVVAT